ncbi:MAG: VCBS repeat-containing protein [Paludibacteraceae bacterium]|nr:VCBS repeat-containing protein [Paludibacteraceae bacterium]
MKKHLVSIVILCTLLIVQSMQAQTVSITATDWATAQSLSSGAVVTDYTQAPITLSFSQGTGSQVTYNGTAIAAGEGNTLTITATSGYQLTAMSLTQNVAAQATRLAGNSWSAGSAAVNGSNNKQVDWTGDAQTVSVTFTGNQVFTNFSVTYDDLNKSFTVTFVGADGTTLKTESVLYGKSATPPTPPTVSNKVFAGWDKDYTNITEDLTVTALYDFSPEVMKDTVKITPKEIMDYNELTSGEEFEAVDFTKDGVTIAISKATAYSSPRIEYNSYYYNYAAYLRENSTLTISAPFKIHKVVMGTWYYNSTDGSFACSSGEVTVGELNGILREITWTGSTSKLTITMGSNGWDFCAIYFHIIGDKSDTKCNVTFYDFDGKILDKQQVTAGSSITTPPTVNDKCFTGWDTPLNGIYDDLEIHPVREKLLDLTAKEWEDSETGNKQIAVGDFTLIPTNRWSDKEADFGDTNLGNWNTRRHLIMRANKPFTIAGKDWFQNLTLVCADGYAEKLAAATFSNGTAKQEGDNVVWSGDTDSLIITPTQDCNVYEFVIYCKQHETPTYTVIFLDENDKEIKRETVLRGSSVTPPAFTAPDECHDFTGWDKDLSKVRGDMTVRPVLELKRLLSLSAIGWARLQNDSTDNAEMQDVETKGYSFSTPNSVLNSTKQRIDGKWVTTYYITIYRGGKISISSDYYVRNITFTVLNEHDAQNLAAATFSQGSATRDGIRVTWTGATDRLEITLPTDDNIGLTLIEINCEVITDHKVTILDKDGKVLKSETVADGGSVTPPEDQTPENECYVFKGWSERLTNIRTDLTVEPVFEYIEGCTPEGFVKVTFVDFAGNLIESSFVEIGGTAVAPKAPELPFHTFTGWDHPLDNIKAEQISESPTDGVRVKLDPESCESWTEVYLFEWNNWGGYPLGEWPGTKVSKDMYGWWSYTYEETGERNIIWNNGKGEQTVDINNVSESTCYQLDGKDGEKYKVKASDCPSQAEGLIIRPLYTFNMDAEGILSVKEATDIIDSIKNKYSYREEHLDDYHAVKGVVYLTSELWTGGRLSVRITENGEYEYGTNELRGYSMLGPGLEQFVSKMQLQQGDTVILFGKFIQDRFSEGYGSKEWGLGKGYIPYIGKKVSDEGVVYINMPDAATMYDINGDGKKQALYVSSDNNLIVSGDMSNNFLFEKSLCSGLPSSSGKKAFFLSDINHDDDIDLGIATMGNYGDFSAISILSGDEGYTKVDGALFLPQFDLNGDGRTDHLVVDPKSWFVSDFGAGGGLGYGTTYRENHYYIGTQQPDGTYNLEYVQAMSWDEYEALMSDTEWAATYKEKTYSSGNGLITPNYGYATAMLSGVSISDGRAPRRPNGSASIAHPKHAPAIGYTVNSITKAVDLNADNLIDLIDEKNGNVYLNMGDGRFIIAETNGMVVPADLNNDGLMDFIFPGEKLYVSIYKGEGKFETKTLYENAAVDALLYCYDFDRDGDIDILATFSAATNATGIAYTCFFINDGQGNFTQQPEQNYGSEKLWFSALQDIDGDGYYDLLAFNGNNSDDSWESTEHSVAWLRGNANLTFSAPQALFTVEYAGNPTNMRINAEDLDNDGKAEIWVSGLAQGKTQIFTTEFGAAKTFGVTANTAPTAPAAPELRYENGMLTVTWGDGQDKETMTGDLTYALRLGTTKGGNDILNAFANANGSRRNFLDGNMGKNHSYKIDLSTYAPATIYAAVQAIDAQHKGSSWSVEASVEHTALPAQFTLSSEKIAFNEVVTVSYTALPDGYSHKWLYDDGELRRDGSFLKLSFPTAGEKVITHTVTAPDGKAASYSITLIVLPAGLSDDAIEFSDWNDGQSNNFYTMGMNPKADFNGDGLLDIFRSVSSNSDTEVYIAQATSLTEYTQATGLWNTNINAYNWGDAKWLDWNRNGYADLLTYSWSRAEGYHYYILPHADNAQDMTAQREDATIEGILRSTGASETTNYYNLYPLAADLLNNGVPSVFGYTYFNSSSSIENASFRVVQSDGSYNYIPLSTNGDMLILGQALQNAQQSGQISNDVRDGLIDYNRDGFTDILFLNSVYKDNVNKYECLYIFQNNGNGNFTQLTVPFASEIATDDLYYPQYADLNNDGYYDIIAFKTSSNKSELYILWNNGNSSFSEPEIMPVSEIGSFGGSTYDNIKLIDIDNDGYLDVLSQQQNPTVGSDVSGLYVWYMGAQGVRTQGFLIPQVSSYFADLLFTEFPNELLYKESYETGSYYSSRTRLRRVIGVNENKQPSAPSNLRAVQTEGGLLVEWNTAEDDHTPATQMRYNLSVKHAGRTGEGAFVISPQNGLNSKSAYLPGHKYIQSTRLLVPLAYLTAGDYEVQVQAIDQRNLMSDFSEKIIVNIDRQIIDAPTTICLGDEALITYMSEDRTGTPAWDFDGGKIESGTGFGPYRVSWDSKGTKTISLTLGSETYTRMLYVDEIEGWANLPSALFDGGSVEVEWADGLSGDLQISINGALQSITKKGINGRDPQLTFDGHTLSLDTRKAWSAANALTNFESIGLILYLSNANGCEASAQSSVQIINATNIPQISLVTSDVDGNNVISWDADESVFTQIQVLKETNVRDQFVELGTVSTNLGRFTDVSSDATQRAERYAIRGIMYGGTKTPVSAIHQTVHTTINRGANDNQWNLIWNQYVGADVVTYNILRGSAEGNLTQIASVSSYNTSYTDYAPQDAQPYYAIEYVLSGSEQPSLAPGYQRAPENPVNPVNPENPIIRYAPQAQSLQGRSNIVNRVAAKTMTYARSLTILSANGKYETTAENTMLLLYAEVMPSNTTYKQVVWEITAQPNLADIDQSSGLLTARTPNNGGTITVRATAVDGSGVTATRQIKIAAIIDDTPVEPTYFTVTFYDMDGITVLKTQQVEQGGNATAPQAPTHEGYTFLGWDKAYNNVQSDLAVIAQYRKDGTPVDYTPKNLRTEQDGNIVYFLWDAVEGATEYEFVLTQGENIIYSTATDRQGVGLDFSSQQPGNYSVEWKVRTTLPEVSDWATATYTIVVTDIEEVEVQKQWSPRKVIEDGHVYIILPDGTRYDATGQRVR